MSNDYFRRMYKNAPSAAVKELLEYRFYASKYGIFEGLKEKNREVEERFNIEDWEYMSRCSGKTPYVGKCIEKIKELKKA